jgi:replicative DNA helicase
MSVLGAMMMSKDAISDVVGVIRGSDFHRPVHETIYEAAIALFGRGEPVDAITVTAELQKRGELVRVGGSTYLHDLVAGVPRTSSAGYYAQIVYDRSVMRKMVSAGLKITDLGFGADGGDLPELVNSAQSIVYELTNQNKTQDYQPLSSIVQGTLRQLEIAEQRGGEMVGVPTGFADLDQLTHGLHPGQMIILAARPAIGKSTLALDIARCASVKHKQTSVIFSLEMSKDEIMMRLLSAETNVNLKHMRAGTLSHEEWARLSQGAIAIDDAPMLIDDSPNLTLMEIRAKARRIKQQHDLKLVVVDYLQLLMSGKSRVESRQQEVSEFSRALKLLAKELEVPVIAVAQLNRKSEERTDKKPQMSDLRESGSLEQDADVVLLLHREDFGQQDHPRAGEADFIVAKHRNGPTGTVTVAFQGHYSRFVDMPHQY